MSEDVFNVVQIGQQAGTFSAPGAAVPATFLYPISSRITPELERGGTYPEMDRGRNVRNMGGSGYLGVRRGSVTLPSEVRYEDIMPILRMIYAGAIAPSVVGSVYTWLYPFEAGIPTLVPCTIETGNIDSASAQEQMPSCLVSQLTMGFAAVTAGQASPWTLSADLLGFDRAVSALTGSLNPVATALETVQGHLTRLYEGTVATAFASLAELGASLRSFSLTAQRNLIARAYGSASDLPSKFGFTAMSTVSYELVVAVSATAKTDLHDVWNTSGASLGERRLRIQGTGSALSVGNKKFTIDARAGLYAIPWDDGDGERVYKVTGEFSDDTTLGASHTVSVVNAVSAIP